MSKTELIISPRKPPPSLPTLPLWVNSITLHWVTLAGELISRQEGEEKPWDDVELEEHDLIGIFKMEGLWATDLTPRSFSRLLHGSYVVVVIIWMCRISPLPSLASGFFFFLLHLVISFTGVAHFASPGLSPPAPSVDLSLAISLVHLRGTGW